MKRRRELSEMVKRLKAKVGELSANDQEIYKCS